MKTIEEATISLEYNVGVLMSNPEEIARISFICGIQFAQRWIPIEEDKPQEGERILSAPSANPEDHEVEMAIFKNGKFISVHRDLKSTIDDSGEIISTFYKRQELNDTTHWRKINLK
jgi:hypothetical protein